MWDYPSDSVFGWTWDGEDGQLWHAVANSAHGADWPLGDEEVGTTWVGGDVLQLRLDVERGELIASRREGSGAGGVGRMRELGEPDAPHVRISSERRAVCTGVLASGLPTDGPLWWVVETCRGDDACTVELQ